MARFAPSCNKSYVLLRAEELVQRLLIAYDTPTGIPYNSIALDTLEVRNPTWTRRSSTLSEFGSEQLEFAKLSMHSGNATYAEKAESVIQYLYEKHPDKVGTALPPCLSYKCRQHACYGYYR